MTSFTEHHQTPLRLRWMARERRNSLFPRAALGCTEKRCSTHEIVAGLPG